MAFLESIRIAMSSLLANRLRSVLATLGIMIGIAAVSILLSVGQSFQAFTLDQFQGLDTNALTLTGDIDYRSTGMFPSEPQLTDGDIEAIAKVDNIKEIVARYQFYSELYANGQPYSGQIVGIFPHPDNPDFQAALGRSITQEDIDTRARVAVLEWPMAQQIFSDGRPLGREITISGLTFTVVGVLPDKGQGGFFFNPSIYVPMSTARDRLQPQSAFSKVQVNNVTIYVEDTTRLSETQEEITQLLRKRHKLNADTGNDFMFSDFREFVETYNNILSGITAFLAVIGGIALLVGGIGITNIMLVSVTERTREIGLRKAVGARRRDILFQFLIEAVVLSLIGGMGGVLFTAVFVHGGAILLQVLFASFGLARFLVINVDAILLALAFASVIGVVAGIYPAYRASRLSPIQALRSE